MAFVVGGDYSVLLNKKTALYQQSKVKSLKIFGGQGNEIFIENGINIPTTVVGGSGQDVIQTSFSQTVIETNFDDNIDPVSGNTIQYVFQGPDPQKPKTMNFTLSLLGTPGDMLWQVQAVEPNGNSEPEGSVAEPSGSQLTFSFTSGRDIVDVSSNSNPTTFNLGGGNDAMDFTGSHDTVIGGSWKRPH